ncbi:MAG: FHA domain-containing protein [Salinibacterium sp.]|nr:MAG: FHA domain-containing protein [Salinibacterium sp.]
MTEDNDDTIIVPQRPLELANAIVPSFDDVENTRIVPAGERPKVTAPPPPDEPEVVVPQFCVSIGAFSQPIPLDRPAYIGRRPSPPRISSGLAPRLVVVPSPLKEVSSTHLEVRQVGASVIVTDLKSTNGSIVHIPGSMPRKLRQGESLVVSTGTLVDIGDDNVIEILPMQRLG